MEIDERNTNRGLLKLYESLTEEEYDTLNCISYSKVKDIHDNPEVLTRERSSDNKEWLTFGTLVDIILTQPKEVLEKKVFVNDKVPSEQFVKASNYIIDNNLLPNGLTSDIAKMTTSQIAEIYTNSGSLSRYTPEVKMEKLINECGDYLELLTLHKDKIIVDTNTYNEATKVAEVFRTHKWSKDLFMSKKEQEDNYIEILYQYKIKYVYNGIQCKSKIDIVVIDHDLKIVTLYDIKTGSDLPRHFIKHAVYKYKYGYQGVLYREGFEIFLQKYPAFKDYDIDNFKFVYVSRLKPTYPVIIQMDDLCHTEIKEIGVETELYSLIALDELFEEAEYYMDKINSGETNISPYDLQTRFGEVVMSSTHRSLAF